MTLRAGFAGQGQAAEASDDITVQEGLLRLDAGTSNHFAQRIGLRTNIGRER